jgi:hypothetical protein
MRLEKAKANSSLNAKNMLQLSNTKPKVLAANKNWQKEISHKTLPSFNGTLKKK